MELRQQATQEIVMASGMDPNMNQDLIMERMRELEPEFIEAEQEIADKAAEAMTTVIADQLIEADSDQKLKQSMLEACIFGSGAVKAGTVRIDRKQSYQKAMDEMGNQTYVMAMIEEAVPELESVSIFDLYPDPYCTTLEDCDGLFRRHVLTRTQFRALADLPGFDGDMVRYLLKNYRKGNYVEEDHERDRRRIAGIHDHSEPNRFEVFEYWGNLDGHELKEHGIELPRADLSADFSAVFGCATQDPEDHPEPDRRVQDSIPYLPLRTQSSSVLGHRRPPHDARFSEHDERRRAYLARQPCPVLWSDAGSKYRPLGCWEDPTDIHPWRVFLREGGMALCRQYAGISQLQTRTDSTRLLSCSGALLMKQLHCRATRTANKVSR